MSVNIKLKPITDEQRQRITLVHDCRALAFLLQDTYHDFDVRVSEHKDGGFSCEPYERYAERSLTLYRDGRVVLTTWETSGHNGDSYGEESCLLEPAKALDELVRLKAKLQQRAIAAERKQQAEERDRAEREALLRVVNSKLSYDR